MALESVFAGLPPSYVEREKLDAEKLFIQGDRSVLEEEKNTYILDTARFQNAILKFSSQMSTHGRYSYDFSFVIIAKHMNNAARAEKFLDHIHSAVSASNIPYLDSLTNGINWGINAMFHSTNELHTAYNSIQRDEMKRAHDTMIATINILGDHVFTPPAKPPGLPTELGVYKSRVISRTGGACELTGARFIGRTGSFMAANCIAAHIIPKRMCVFSDEGSGVFAWLVLALILSQEQFNMVWNECSAQDSNNPDNLLLLLDEIELVYDQAYFRLFYSNSKHTVYPLLRCDYLDAMETGRKLSMCFEWLVEEPFQRNHWHARRIDCSEDGSKSVVPPMSTGVIGSAPAVIDYISFESTVPNPSPVLLDAHNLMASLYQQFTPYRKPGRHEFPVNQYGLWRNFIRSETPGEKSGSRQRFRGSGRSSFSPSRSVYPSRQQNSRGGRDLGFCSYSTEPQSLRDGAHHDFDKHHPLGDGPTETGPDNDINFQQAINQYLEKSGSLWIDEIYGGDIPNEEGESSYAEYLRYNAFIPAWRDSIIHMNGQ
ncbi:hypothetical protein HCBG_02191 [Histoplasma capsulatum G186AR]|uniref:HNH nuclease domain-containing protein n=2 Tax=Ajellomyces capsulatus TaxID=5037 RepID=C0NID4_AJECG|nr:uncharacterized protein HCBG_02191 [Histoplasma capsulatum G186AR]EEH08654.1 hypothetical protein HCBG_02191 [Histoplasma capsulatum G186AR]KAG5304035.1 hypothetical protein I7I52_02227 [Histoplasma capsulatum]QSS69634.1 hypothetical protein I7I50_10989 [Histoplasma capsulatum G186AR]